LLDWQELDLKVTSSSVKEILILALFLELGPNFTFDALPSRIEEGSKSNNS
jgi:hypothetical protein